jgi:hypothetical protein
VRGEAGLGEQIHAHVIGREVVRRRQPRLVHDERARGVGDPGAVELHPDPFPGWLEANLVFGAHGFSSHDQA